MFFQTVLGLAEQMLHCYSSDIRNNVLRAWNLELGTLRVSLRPSSDQSSKYKAQSSKQQTHSRSILYEDNCFDEEGREQGSDPATQQDGDLDCRGGSLFRS